MKSLTGLFHHLFVPKDKNNYRAKSLHIDFLTIYLIAILLFTFAVKNSNSTNILGYATDMSTSKLLELTNRERAQQNLPILVLNDKLSEAAALKAHDMFKKNYWAHYTPEGKTPWDFITAANYNYEYAGENLAKNFLYTDGVISAWMKSKSHRDNILRKEYTEVGFAVMNGVLNGEQTTLIVQMLGKPSTTLTSPQEKNVHLSEKPVAQSNNSFVLSQNTTPSLFHSPNILLFTIMGFITFLLLALIFDLYFASKMRLTRVGGKNLAHLIFIALMVIGLYLLTKGAII